MLKYLKDHRIYLLLSLILSIVIYSYNFTSRLNLSLNDEAIYILGDQASYPGFGPFYLAYYQLLKYFIASPIELFYLQNFFISLIAFPFSIYLLLNSIHLNSLRTFLITTVATLAYWNFPSDNKVQIFNFIYLVIIFIYFWPKKRLLFYLGLTLSLFIRQDNLILLIVFLIFDHLKYYLIPLISFPIFSLIFSNPFSKIRSLDTFIDHLYFSNLKHQQFQIPDNIHYKVFFQKFLNHPQSLLDIVINHPEVISRQVIHNLKQSPEGIIQIFSLGLKTNFSYPLYSAAILILMFIVAAFYKTENKIEINQPTKIFLSALFIKCILTCLLLSWWTKYSFELFFILMILFFIIADRIVKKTSKQSLAMTALIFPLIFVGYKFIPYQGTQNVALKQSIQKINNLLIPNQHLNLFAPNNLKAYLHTPVKIFDPLVKTHDYDLLRNGHFTLEQFSIIILPNQYQIDLENVGINITQSVYQLDPDIFVINHEQHSNLIFVYKKSLSSLSETR